MKRSFPCFWTSILLALLHTTNISAQCNISGDNLGATTIHSIVVADLNYTTSQRNIQENTNALILVDENITSLSIELESKENLNLPIDSVYWRIWIDTDNNQQLDNSEIVYDLYTEGGNRSITDNITTGLSNLPLGQAVTMRILLTDDLSILNDPCNVSGVTNSSFKILDLLIKSNRSGGRVSATNTSNGLLNGCGFCVTKDNFNFEIVNHHAFAITDVEITQVIFIYEDETETSNLVGNDKLQAITQVSPDGSFMYYFNQNLPLSSLESFYKANLRLNFPMGMLKKGCGTVKVEGIYKVCGYTECFKETIPVEFKCNDRGSALFTAPIDKKVVFKPYPNPFHDQLHLKYQLEKQGYVKITLHNLSSAKLIQTLFKGEKQTGIHHLSIDTSTLNKGMYICTVQVDDSIFTHFLSKIE